MASSNRHWPSMFKSKPCNPLHQWQHDLNPSSLLSGCHRNPYTSGGVEERNPEPKPRWNPKPEQIRILEAIFNSGMVNPPRDEIRKIRVQLQEFGQVGDANVFYWFQNRKSRSKNKNRQPSKNQSTNKSTATPTMITKVSSSSSSSSDKSSSKLINSSKTTYSPTGFSLGSCSSSQHLDQLQCSPTASVNLTYDQLVQQEPFMFPMQQQQQLNFSTQGFTGFPDHQAHEHQQMMMLNNANNNDLINIPHSNGPCTEFLFNELINNSKKDAEDEEKLMMMKLGYAADPSATSSVSNNVPVSDSTAGMPLHPTLSQLQGADHSSGSAIAGPMKSTVLINDVAFEVNCGPFHVREAFGNDAVLLHSTGQPVLTDEWGVTLQPLLHGAFYYLI